ncbi:MAG: hypothetical protein ACLF0P_14115 [Thermoanaerobaculia bacterium]
MPETRNVELQIRLGGGATVTRAAVTLYAVTREEPRVLERRELTGPRATVQVPSTDGAELFYAVARIHGYELGGQTTEVGDRTVQLVAVFDGTAETVALSETVTVATAYCFSRFTRVAGDGAVAISDPHRAAHLALGMKTNFVAAGGITSPVIESPPNGLQTNSLAMLNFLANLVLYALTDPAVYDAFTRLAGDRPGGGGAAGSLFGALLDLALHPFGRSRAVYDLVAERPQPYSPSLPELDLPEGFSPVPSQWTLTVKVNDSGARNFLIGGVGYLDFDRHDRVWLTDNVRQGTPNSGTFCVVLEPDGSPAPFSPLFGGGLLGAGFGVAANPERDEVWIGNFGWGPTEWNPQSGSVSAFDLEGRALSPSQGFTPGLSRVQGMTFDRHGNLWMASWGSQDPMPPTDSHYNFESENSALVVYLGGDPERVAIHSFDSPYHLSFDVTVDGDGNAYVANSGSADHGVRSSVHKLRLEGDELVHLASWESDHVTEKPLGKGTSVGFETLRQVAIGPSGDVYVVGVSSGRVVRLSPDLRPVGSLTNRIAAPWGIGFDREGVMYVANFAREMDYEDEDPAQGIGPHAVTVIRDEDDATAELMTLPTGGEPVTLANGLPLYGNPETGDGKPIPLPSHDPLMRLTATRVDRAGNLWACNNWKPSAFLDVVRGNPGGDGLVIFVGAAAPAHRAGE